MPKRINSKLWYFHARKKPDPPWMKNKVRHIRATKADEPVIIRNVIFIKNFPDDLRRDFKKLCQERGVSFWGGFRQLVQREIEQNRDLIDGWD